ncbi:MAG: hypothetical protein CL670_14210 [Balneola sp.]|jgi:hypothetical protein|nr:hypothetical protein [Balneola sp.]MBE80308.1 hypothetical protein [Balneola sp.]|tara:strand:+ start:564 stop:1349 length:786 start_codon:yes stop_codon:yes gene_type:complete
MIFLKQVFHLLLPLLLVVGLSLTQHSDVIAQNTKSESSVITIPVSKVDPSSVKAEPADGENWRLFTLPKKDHTKYEPVTEDGETFIKSTSNNSASGLLYMTDIDPKQYPIMEWTWKTDGVLENGNMSKKGGDDYSARIYVTFKYDKADLPLGERIKYGTLKTFTSFEIPLRSLNYVWANTQPVGTFQENVFTNWVYMIAVESGNEKAGQWVTSRVNIYEDYKKAFGEEPKNIESITIMTDSDNTEGSANGYFKNIYFKESK